ncbi:hypothetical protein ANCDUO_05149 [Ancylostoma duodenale]|uniref:Uncharacterized protein n=1 Tax=Ancylostoma duodenale TaxID=51022 RepID=A0A0C2GTE0_9BILA|nr:hypothetical protein ANCDUO_05149 [Ancylostoma duodenale]
MAKNKIREWQVALADSGLKPNFKKTEAMSSVEEHGDVSDASGTEFMLVKKFQYLGGFLEEVRVMCPVSNPV